MAEGFIADQDKCVACNACVAACNVINGSVTGYRKVFVVNKDSEPYMPVLNLSMACNHCVNAMCLTACPTGAIFRDVNTGAVLCNSTACIGCSYCTWNCPYDAPVIKESLMAKCNLCIDLLTKGLKPACTTACPTGALAFGETGETTAIDLPWFPAKKHRPNIFIKRQVRPDKPVIIPSHAFESKVVNVSTSGEARNIELSLLIFTFVSVLVSALQMSRLIAGEIWPVLLIPALILTAASASLFHLGKKEGAWRAVTNFRTSPLSREIVFFVFFSILTLVSLLIPEPFLIILASLAALAYLISIDLVYESTNPSGKTLLHPGQSLLTGLLITSFIAGQKLPFTFVASVKLVLLAFTLLKYPLQDNFFGARYLRIIVLIISMLYVMKSIHVSESLIAAVFLSGELADRIFFYYDFRPLKITDLISKYQKAFR